MRRSRFAFPVQRDANHCRKSAWSSLRMEPCRRSGTGFDLDPAAVKSWLTRTFSLAEHLGDQAEFEGLGSRNIAVLGCKFVELVRTERAALRELAEALEF